MSKNGLYCASLSRAQADRSTTLTRIECARKPLSALLLTLTTGTAMACCVFPRCYLKRSLLSVKLAESSASSSNLKD